MHVSSQCVEVDDEQQEVLLSQFLWDLLLGRVGPCELSGRALSLGLPHVHCIGRCDKGGLEHLCSWAALWLRLGVEMEVDTSPLSCTQAQAVTLTVAQAFQMALDLWEAANAGRRNFSDISLCLVLGLGFYIARSCFGLYGGEMACCLGGEMHQPGHCPCCCALCCFPMRGACSVSGRGCPAIHAKLLCTAELLHSSGPCGTCPEQCPPHPAPMLACTVPQAQQGHLSLAHSLACTPPLSLVRVPGANSAAFALSQALGRNSPFTLHVSWSAVSPAEQVSQLPRGALPSDTSLGYSMCKSGPCPGLSHIRAGEE